MTTVFYDNSHCNGTVIALVSMEKLEAAFDKADHGQEFGKCDKNGFKIYKKADTSYLTPLETYFKLDPDYISNSELPGIQDSEMFKDAEIYFLNGRCLRHGEIYAKANCDTGMLDMYKDSKCQGKMVHQLSGTCYLGSSAGAGFPIWLIVLLSCISALVLGGSIYAIVRARRSRKEVTDI